MFLRCAPETISPSRSMSARAILTLRALLSPRVFHRDQVGGAALARINGGGPVETPKYGIIDTAVVVPSLY